MSFKVIADTFSVARDSDHFIQLKTIKKPLSDEQVWLAIEIVGDSKYARATTQKMVDAIEDVFFDDPAIDAYERFENALKEINLVVANLKSKKGAGTVGDISAIVAAFSGNDLHLTQSSNAEAYLLRKGKFSMISEGLASRSDDLFTNIASGDLLADDKVILSTTRLLRIATNSQLSQLFSDGVTEALDGVRELVMADEEINLGVSCIHVKSPQTTRGDLSKIKSHPILLKLKEFFDGTGKKVASKVGTKVSRSAPKLNLNLSKNTILIAIVAVFILLIVSVNVLMNSRRDRAFRDEYRIRIEALNQDLNTASTKGYANDKETANAILEKVEAESRDILQTNYFRPEVLALLEKVQDTRDSINNTERIKGLAPFADLSIKNPDVEAQGFINMDENFFVYGLRNLQEVILDQVLEPKTIDADEVVIAGSAIEDQGVIVFLTQSGRVIEYDKNEFRFVNTDDDAWKTGIDVQGYGRNIYILNPTDNQIYKYSRLRNKFSAASQYNQDADLSDAIDIAIDGNVYVLKKGGNIMKMFKSKEVPYKIDDLATDLSNVSKLYTALELDYLYLLDPVAKKIIVVEKTRGGNGLYRAQYVFDDLPEIVDFYVNKSEDKLYLLTKKEIYQIDI